MRDYETLLSELHSRPRYAKKKDLSRITALMNALGNPQDRLPFVHVAGTNGKGSVCAMTAAVLRAAGERTGLFTSPYLKEFTERIQIDGRQIPKDDFCRLYEQVYAEECALEAAGQDPANEFELITAIAMLWFTEQTCDRVVLEVGLGGRLDATNIIPPQAVCCITQLGLDHQAQLGSTLREVAGEKAGIIKPGSIVVTPNTQAPEALEVLEHTCIERGAELRVTGQPIVRQLYPDHTAFTYQGEPFTVSLAGPHQAQNAACAIEICRALSLPEEAIQTGLARTEWPGRLQAVAPDAVLDCAHNPNGIQALLRAVETVYPNRPFTALMAMMADKDYETCVQAIASRARRMIATTLDMPRALSAEELAECASMDCSQVRAVSDVGVALREALADRKEDELLVICGSVYLAGEVLRLFDKK